MNYGARHLLTLVCSTLAGRAPLPFNTGFQIQMLGGYLSVDSSGYVTIDGSITVATEETTFIAYSVTDPAGATPIEAGEPALFRSSRTGRWCRLAAVSGGQGLVCNQATVNGATELLYTGYSLEVASQELVSDGSSLLLDQGGAATAGGDSSLVCVPSRECQVLAACGCLAHECWCPLTPCAS